MNWEYKIRLIDRAFPPALQDELNELGREGWEVIKIDGNLFYFKRPTEERE